MLVGACERNAYVGLYQGSAEIRSRRYKHAGFVLQPTAARSGDYPYRFSQNLVLFNHSDAQSRNLHSQTLTVGR
jgi:hypothetical protein